MAPEQNGINGWGKFIAQVGIPGALLFLLLWFFLPVVVKQGEALPRLETKLDAHQKHTEDLHRNIEDYMRVQNLLTRQLCVNSARTPQERVDCFKP